MIPEEHERRYGRWSEPGLPHKGWICIDVIDLGEGASKLCEMCEHADIRYVHYMAHEDYPQVLDVGCVCASHWKPTARRRGSARPS